MPAQRRDVKFGIQIGSDWPQMGQIWDFLRSVSVHFGEPKCTETDLKKSPDFYLVNGLYVLWL